jgi:uncharacterized protein
VKIEGTYNLNAPRDDVWAAILEPEVLAAALPGAQELERVADNDYRGRMNIRVGPVQGLFSGRVTLSNLRPLEGYDIAVDGKGAPGFVRGEGSLSLEAQGEQTLLHYRGEIQVGGRLASIGQRLMESSCHALIRQSLESLDRQIMARAGAPAGEPAPSPEAPSELAFAAGMTRKMLEELIPEEQRPELIRSGVAAVAGLLFLWLLANWWMDRLADRVARRIEGRS